VGREKTNSGGSFWCSRRAKREEGRPCCTAHTGSKPRSGSAPGPTSQSLTRFMMSSASLLTRVKRMAKSKGKIAACIRRFGFSDGARREPERDSSPSPSRRKRDHLQTGLGLLATTPERIHVSGEERPSTRASFPVQRPAWAGLASRPRTVIMGIMGIGYTSCSLYLFIYGHWAALHPVTLGGFL